MPPVQARGKVLGVRKVGAYHVLSFMAPGLVENTRPGQFVALAVGSENTPMLMRRAFSVYQTSTHGTYGGTVEVVIGVHGQGTRWLSRRQQNDTIDVVGPLGRPFSLPTEKASCTLVGGGYGSAPLLSLGNALRSRGCRVDYVLGAATEERLFGALEAKRGSASITVTTEDGSAGVRGVVSDVLADVLDRTGAEVVYACGPMGMLRVVAGVAAGRDIPSQCAVEESMACGIGVCMTCVLPVVDEDGTTRMARSCVEGPVFTGDRVRWDEVGTIPGDALGAAGATGVAGAAVAGGSR